MAVVAIGYSTIMIKIIKRLLLLTLSDREEDRSVEQPKAGQEERREFRAFRLRVSLGKHRFSEQVAMKRRVRRHITMNKMRVWTHYEYCSILGCELMTKNVFFCSSPVCKWIITIDNFLNMLQTVCIWDIPGQKDETCTELRYHNIEFRCLGDRPWGLWSDLSRGINGTHPPKKTPQTQNGLWMFLIWFVDFQFIWRCTLW